jgi:cytochrome c biogenesis protein CcmG/thiol:disulfide interchange protein DsbE
MDSVQAGLRAIQTNILASVQSYRARAGTSSVLRFAALGLLSLLVVILLVSRIAAAQQRTQKAPASDRLVGAVVPDLSINLWNGAQGQTLKLSALQGHPVVLNFWEASCYPCQAEAPLLASAWKAYAPRGVQFVGVALETSDQDGLGFVQSHHIEYPNGPAKTEDVAVRYALVGTPVTLFVNRQGIVVSRSPGQLTAESLKQGIQQALS